MGFRDILVLVTTTDAGKQAIDFADQLASQTGGRITASLVSWQPNVAPVDAFVIDPIYAQLVEDARKELAQEEVRLRSRLEKVSVPAVAESSLIDFGAAGAALGLRARHADISVVARPVKADSGSAQVILEAALFNSGRPVIVVPPEWKRGPIGKNILFAWKPTREAARALGDADDLIANADQVNVVTVDAKPSRDYGEQPGGDIAAHMAYRGAKVKLFNLDSAGRSETRVILDQALVVGADLIVMGGYGRSRMSELIFGGVTREILKGATLPVLMAH